MPLGCAASWASQIKDRIIKTPLPDWAWGAGKDWDVWKSDCREMPTDTDLFYLNQLPEAYAEVQRKAEKEFCEEGETANFVGLTKSDPSGCWIDTYGGEKGWEVRIKFENIECGTGNKTYQPYEKLINYYLDHSFKYKPAWVGKKDPLYKDIVSTCVSIYTGKPFEKVTNSSIANAMAVFSAECGQGKKLELTKEDFGKQTTWLEKCKTDKNKDGIIAHVQFFYSDFTCDGQLLKSQTPTGEEDLPILE